MGIFTQTYAQKGTNLIVKGVPVSGFMDGASIKVTYEGGEVEKTEGLDGAGLNVATHQGATISFTLRETSDSYLIMRGLFEAQQSASLFSPIAPIPVILMTGGGVQIVMANCAISAPGEFATGDKKQGSVEWKIVGTDAI